ncbi:MAG: AAA family ATPase [Lachnospiraceae bacterium]|nr:AAA family ATPase [Lachnospiraceae bacterium]
MIVSQLQIYNFRRFRSIDGKPGLSITFHEGLNALIGENDSGKTAIIDALKLVLLTQSNEYIRPAEDDFYMDETGSSVTEFRIDCVLEKFTDNEAKNFIEYLTFSKEGDSLNYTLKLYYRAWRENHRIFTELRIGQKDDGIIMEGKARELLKAVYLKPLRDAEREMSSGRNSRISQILMSHPVFSDRDGHRLKEILSNANGDIEKYFIEEDGKVILQTIRNTLSVLNSQDMSDEAKLETSDIQLKAILESLSLNAPEIHPGLGELNLLFIAAELLLLRHDATGGLKLALIEELEAHLHPQAQLRLIDYLQNEYNKSGAQIIISTHSTILASKINLRNLILMKQGHGYDLTYGETGLEKGDYLFLQRFLDATKSNLFFAKGVIMVEGDAESLLLPVLAEILGYPLEKYGISIVNVGSKAFLRYSRIFIRKDGSTIGIPVSVVTDCDVKPNYNDSVETGIEEFDFREQESLEAVKEKENRYSVGTVKGFIAPRWTLEYCLAMSCLSERFHRAIYYGKKIRNSNTYSLTLKKIMKANQEAAEEYKKWNSMPKEERAYKIYHLMLDGNDKSGLKAIVAQSLASLLKWDISSIPDEINQEQMFDLDLYQCLVDEKKREDLKEELMNDKYIEYLIKAIQYAVGESI